MRTAKVALVVVVVSLCVALAGCACFNKGEFQYSRMTTIGQELIDLEIAKEKNLVTETEYARLRQQIMKGGPADFDHSGMNF